jgi:hypothetical protein
MHDDLEKLLSSGADDYLVKPLRVKIISEKAAWYGRLGRNAAEEEAGRFLGSVSGDGGARRRSIVRVGSKL